MLTMCHFWAQVVVILCVGQRALTAALLITELHANPLGSESDAPGGRSHEYVEIVNTGPDTLRLDKLLLTDGREVDRIVPFAAPLSPHPTSPVAPQILAPGGCALILDATYSAVAHLRPHAIESSPLLLTTDDEDLGDGLASNDGVLLFWGESNRCDSALAWVADNSPLPFEPGQKILLENSPPPPEGFSWSCRQALFGQRYGVAAADPGCWAGIHQGWIVEYHAEAALRPDSTLLCTLGVVSTSSGAPPFSLSVRDGAGTRQVPQSLGRRSLDTATFLFALSLAPARSAGYTICLQTAAGTVEKQIDLSDIWVAPGSVVISELFPRATPQEPEWFELHNRSLGAVNLAGWSFGSSEQRELLSSTELLIAPQSYVVVCADSALMRRRYGASLVTMQPPHWNALSNYDDSLLLWDNHASLHELVYYCNEWFEGWTTHSLERVGFEGPCDGRSWVLSATPSAAQPNGSVIWRGVQKPAMEIGPLPFTPDGDGRNDYLAVHLKLPPGYRCKVMVVGFSGELYVAVDPLETELWLWDGRLSSGQMAPAGPFFVVAEMYEGQRRQGIRIRNKGVLWR
jgi:hypothetical protein